MEYRQAAYWSGCTRFWLVVLITCSSCGSTGRQPIGQAVLGWCVQQVEDDQGRQSLPLEARLDLKRDGEQQRLLWMRLVKTVDDRMIETRTLHTFTVGYKHETLIVHQMVVWCWSIVADSCIAFVWTYFNIIGNRRETVNTLLGEQLWNDASSILLVIMLFQVTVVDNDHQAECKAINDPHVTTFDKQ